MIFLTYTLLQKNALEHMFRQKKKRNVPTCSFHVGIFSNFNYNFWHVKLRILFNN